MMKRRLLKMFLACIFYMAVILFSSNTAFGGAIEDLEDISGGHIDHGDTTWGNGRDDGYTWADYWAEQRAKQEAERKAKAYDLNEKGNRAYEISDWRTAIKYYKWALSFSPYDPVIRQNLKNAQAYFARQKQEDRWYREREAKVKAEQKKLARQKQREEKQKLAQQKQDERDLKLALAQLKKEQNELDKNPAAWTKKQSKLIQRRLKEPNKTCSKIEASLEKRTSLMGKVPPLPYKKFDELHPGDVLLIGRSGFPTDGIIPVDNSYSGDKVSYSPHTVTYLKTVRGKKLFLDNRGFEGPRIIFEDEFLKKYGPRGADVARLVGEPLNEEQAKKIFTAAVKMAQENRNEIAKNWFGSTLFGTNYGVWGKNNVVCSEASWILLNAAVESTGREIPKSSDEEKVKADINFSPADFTDQRYFVITPLEMPE